MHFLWIFWWQPLHTWVNYTILWMKMCNLVIMFLRNAFISVTSMIIGWNAKTPSYWIGQVLFAKICLMRQKSYKPSNKIFYWPFQGGTSYVDLLCFFLSCVCYVFVRVCLYVLCGHLLGKCWPLGSRFWCLTVILSLSHWYLGSGVVLVCMDSWSLHPYLLLVIAEFTW